MKEKSRGEAPGVGAPYPGELAAAEEELIGRRREEAGLAAGSSGHVGLALSGGGIRSATFCLGVIQAMARADVLRKVDYLSTVSGGGYAGAFLGSLFAREGGSQQRARKALENSRSPEVYWLRENGRYLSPNGSGDTITTAAVYLRNLASVHFVLGFALLAGFLLLHTLRFAVWEGLGESLPSWLRDMCEPGASLIWWSPWVVLPGFILAAVAAPLAWAYWLVQDRFTGRSILPLLATVLVVLTGGVGWFWGEAASPLRMVGAAVACVALLSITFWLLLWGWLAFRSKVGKGAIESKQRSLVSRWFGRALVLCVAAAGIALVDSSAQTIYRWLLATDSPLVKLAVGGASPFAIMAALKRFAAMFDDSGDGTRKSLPVELLVTLTALLLALTGLVVWCVGSHAIAWGLGGVEGTQPNPWAAAMACAVALFLTGLLSHALRFINLSSNQQLYASRLARAYLGASNPERHKAGNANVSEVIKGDDLKMEDYHPEENGGPLHLVNVTINETVSGRSQIEQRDRKGLPMCLGPAGISAGRRSHALWAGNREDAGDEQDGSPPPIEYTDIRAIPIGDGSEFHILGKWVNGKPPGAESHQVEKLSLRHWIAISGAAFSTGTGANTSLGLSLLLGIANVRLGYWWDSTILPKERDPKCEGGEKVRSKACVSARIGEWLSDYFFPVHMHLLDEFLARFHGPARQRWYLSDGGHFENTACYELIRRRVPFIICCDDGADPDYAFQDVGNLVRKARIDFGAEFHFLDRRELERHLDEDLLGVIGGYDEIVRYSEEEDEESTGGPHRKRCYSRKHAFLVRVDYRDEDGDAIIDRSYILFLKPSLTGDEPVDVIEYHGRHGAFPQEPTADQFFDEAQWESYRKLGEHIGAKLFGGKARGKWRPSAMRPLPGAAGEELAGMDGRLG